MSIIDAQSPIDLIISPRKKNLGGCFDHMGPVTFAPGEEIDVRPSTQTV
tara:strand:+ start:196 stop:342 length:147 start_codon:yes stop_codon:yes gene_type:complete